MLKCEAVHTESRYETDFPHSRFSNGCLFFPSGDGLQVRWTRRKGHVHATELPGQPGVGRCCVSHEPASERYRRVGGDGEIQAVGRANLSGRHSGIRSSGWWRDSCWRVGTKCYLLDWPVRAGPAQGQGARKGSFRHVQGGRGKHLRKSEPEWQYGRLGRCHVLERQVCRSNHRLVRPKRMRSRLVPIGPQKLGSVPS